MGDALGTQVWAWAAIAGLGAFHGLNPAMGWLFAVSAGLEARRGAAVFKALPPIAGGHFAAMAVALLPFALLGAYLERLTEIRLAAGALLIGFGVYRLLRQRHPRWLARIGPSRLALWSFLMATAHGAGLMLVPAVLVLCGGTQGHTGHAALLAAAGNDLGLTVLAAALHTLVMMGVGGAIAWGVYRHLGLRFLNRSWFNLDLLWALMLIAAGGVALWQALP
ncbi:MAG: hypothetical protein KF788_09555 [Piscinibacter sp.]|nr:hypothetical protein [Piscinibacter sp.]